MSIRSNFCHIQKTAWFWFILLTCLAGCSTVSQSPVNILPSINKKPDTKTSHLKSWNLQGAIAVKTQQKGWNASFNWSQKYANYYLNIFGPLGSNRISLQGNDQYAVLTTHAKTYEAANAETLLAQQLGWYMPVNSIYYWIRGLTAPGIVNHALYNMQGQLISFEQQGWHIEYLAYNQSNGFNLPALIELQNAKLTIRIAIHEWTF